MSLVLNIVKEVDFDADLRALANRINEFVDLITRPNYVFDKYNMFTLRELRSDLLAELNQLIDEIDEAM